MLSLKRLVFSAVLAFSLVTIFIIIKFEYDQITNNKQHSVLLQNQLKKVIIYVIYLLYILSQLISFLIIYRYSQYQSHLFKHYKISKKIYLKNS